MLKSAPRRANQRRKFKLLTRHLHKLHRPVSSLPQNIRYKYGAHGWTLLVSQLEGTTAINPTILCRYLAKLYASKYLGLTASEKLNFTLHVWKTKITLN